MQSLKSNIKDSLKLFFLQFVIVILSIFMVIFIYSNEFTSSGLISSFLAPFFYFGYLVNELLPWMLAHNYSAILIFLNAYVIFYLMFRFQELKFSILLIYIWIVYVLHLINQYFFYDMFSLNIYDHHFFMRYVEIFIPWIFIFFYLIFRKTFMEYFFKIS